jgi:sialic acid synthase SpsE
LKLPFIASVYDFEGIDFLVAEGAAGLKISRHNLTHLPLVAHAARSGLPVILDAGLCYLDELARTVQTAQREGVSGLIINHHPGMQPTPPERHNLRVMQTWKQTFNVPVGLACHYRGDELVFASIGLGANFIEKGVVEDNTRVEQDVVSATNLADLPALWQRMRNCSAALGATLPQIDEPRNLNTRRGLVARRAITAGEMLTLENVGFAWPPLGIRVEDWESVAKRPAHRALAAGEVIAWGDVRFDA